MRHFLYTLLVSTAFISPVWAGDEGGGGESPSGALHQASGGTGDIKDIVANIADTLQQLRGGGAGSGGDGGDDSSASADQGSSPDSFSPASSPSPAYAPPSAVSQYPVGQPPVGADGSPDKALAHPIHRHGLHGHPVGVAGAEGQQPGFLGRLKNSLHAAGQRMRANRMQNGHMQASLMQPMGKPRMPLQLAKKP